MSFDKDMIRLLKSNDEEKIRYSFNCVYNQYYKLVCFCISQYVKNKQDVEELANDTFISLFNNITNLQESKNLKYYILVTAKNNAINFLKKNEHYTTMPEEQLINIPYHQNFESNMLINRLKAILTQEEIDILINHLIYGYSFKEIAKYENKSINTITSKYRRSIKKAHDYLSEVKLWTKKRKK